MKAIRLFKATDGFDDYICIININKCFSELTLMKNGEEEGIKCVKSCRCNHAVACIRTLRQVFPTTNKLQWRLA